MAFNSSTFYSCPSRSSSSEPPSSATSSISTPHTPLSMARPPSSERLTPHTTPPSIAGDLPRPQVASKGGCWTCRLRRKKCDEQRQEDSDSCYTCVRLKIKCLGWGPKRPDWMRDKQAVEAYKAEIKHKLTRAGMLHGIRRSSNTAHTASHPYARKKSSTGPSTLPRVEQDSSSFHYVQTTQPVNISRTSSSNSGHNTILPAISNGSSSSVQLGQQFTDNIFPTEPFFPFFPQDSSPPAPINTHLYDYNPFTIPEMPVPSPTPTPSFAPLAGQSTVQGEHVLYYFEHVRRMQYVFAGNAITNVTYSMIVQEPQGAVTNAICALSALHYRRVRVAQGLLAPETNPEHSNAKIFHDKAYYQLVNAKQLRGHYNESDAIAALHLISFSLFSGGTTDWRNVLTVALDWLGQSGLAGDENPRLSLLNMTFASRCALKITMWLDIFSSITLMRPPQYLALYRRLLAGGCGGASSTAATGAQFWVGSDLHDDSFDLRMESLCGCPDDVMLAIAEVSALAHWKDAETRSRSLSVRELVRRGDRIEEQLRPRNMDRVSYTEVDPVPLHPSLTPAHSGLTETGQALPFPDQDMRRLAASIYRESALLYLHTVLSDNYPAVPEISESVGQTIQLLEQLPISEVDCSLVFPICMAGCMTDDPVRREILKRRLQVQDRSIGNLLLTCAVMETVWQRRDNHGTAIDWRETTRDHNLNLLLV